MMKMVITPEVGTPRGIKCRVCNKIAREGQSILYDSVQNVGHLVWHKNCMEKIIKDSADDLENSINEEYLNIQMEYGKGIFNV